MFSPQRPSPGGGNALAPDDNDNNNANPNNLLAELSRYPFRLRCPAPTQIPVGVQIEVQLTDIDLWQRTAQFEYIDTKGGS